MQRSEPKNSYYDPRKAAIAVAFIEKCCVHPKGSLTGQPFILEPWEKKDLIHPLFGWRDEATGLRKFTSLLLSMPRKNGKTVLCAVIGLYLLLVEQQGTVPEIVSLATDEAQARIVFTMAKSIVEKSPILANKVKVLRDRIVPVGEDAAFMKAINRAGGGKHGLSPSGAICDEVAQYQPEIGAKLLEAIETGSAERENPLNMYISTCGSNFASNLLAPYWQYGKAIIAGTVEDDSFLPCIYGADEGDDWTDRQVWRKANPNLGVSVREEFLEKQYRRALQVPSAQTSFKIYHLNMWVKSSKQWVDLIKWNKGALPLKLDGDRRCWGGLDLSSTGDLTSLVLVFEPDEDGIVDILPWFWVPEGALESSPYSKFYEAWAEAGQLVLTPGEVLDHGFARAVINDCTEKFNLISVGLDRWSSSQIVAALNDQDGVITIGYGMGYRTMAAAVRYAEQLIYSNKVRHGGHPVLTWCIDNTIIISDPAGNQKPDKSKSAGKIDGAVAMLIALKNMDDDLIGESGDIWGDKDIFEE